MYEDYIELLKVESWKAKRYAKEAEDIAKDYSRRLALIEQRVLVKYEIKEQAPIDEFALKRKFIQLYKEIYVEIFKKEILEANFKSIEYTRKWKFFTRLAEVVEENIDMLLLSIIEGGAGEARQLMEIVAGDFNDLMEGVEIAREVVNAYNQYTKWGKMPNKARRDMVWREVIWPDDKYYDKTLDIRFTAWGNKAPYWVLLDMGNEEFEGAYPKFTATDFFYQAVQKILMDLNERVAVYRAENVSGESVESQIRWETKQISVKVSNLINEAALKLISNPDSYQPGTVFQRYTDAMDGFEYKIYVTPGRKVGVRKL